ncbi:MAG: sensor histidine kinase [Aggregatilineales bacterium]
MKIKGVRDRRVTKQTIITLSFGLAVAISLVIAVIIFLTTTQLVQDNDWVTHTYLVLNRLAAVEAALVNAESEQRGYLLTGESSYLVPYQSTIDSVPQFMGELRQLTLDNPVQQRRLDDLEPLVSARLTYLQQAIALRQQTGVQAALGFVLTGQGEAAMNSIRTQISQMEDEENQLLTLRTEASRRSTQASLLTFGIGVLVSTTLIVTIFYGLRREVASHTLAEETLATERNLLRTLMDTLPDSVFIKDTKSRFVINNMHHQRILGKTTLDEVVGKTDFDLFPRELAELYYADEQAVVRTGQPVTDREEPTIDATGTHRWHLTTKVPLRDAQGEITGLVGISRDITERKRIEEEINRLNSDLKLRAAALESANKELEAFSYSVSHDLRAPLRAIDGFSRILLEEHAPQLTPAAARYLQRVRDNAQRMGQLIDDLLRFARLSRQPLNKQTVSLTDLVRQVLDELRSEQAGRQVELVTAELSVSEADPALLKQVYVNLISNAFKYTRGREPARIEIGYEDQNGERRYFVKDNGAGFDMQYASKLFGVFQRLHSAQEYEGTGVGLAIVQRVVNRHGGRVWAVGEVNQGATFYFTLGGNNYA